MTGYVFIPFPDASDKSAVRRVARPFARHDCRLTGAWFGRINIELHCDEPVHVGSGFKAEHEDRVLRHTARMGDSLCIPGSSFKGVVRSRFEAITRSCAGDLPSERGRIRSQTYPNVQQGQFAPQVKNMPVFEKLCNYQKMCLACAVFGYQASGDCLRGRVSFGDLLADNHVKPTYDQMPSQYEPRLHHLGNFRIVNRSGIDKFEVDTLYGRKFYVNQNNEHLQTDYQSVEAIPKGTCLKGSLRIFNLEDSELGALILALGIAPQSFLKLGAAKSHGFGRVSITKVEYQLVNEQGAKRESDCDQWATQFKQSSDRWETGVKQLLDIYQE